MAARQGFRRPTRWRSKSGPARAGRKDARTKHSRRAEGRPNEASRASSWRGSARGTITHHKPPIGKSLKMISTMNRIINLDAWPLRARLLAWPLLGLEPEALAQAQAPPSPVTHSGKEQRLPAAQISRQFRGRWAPNAAACRVEGPATKVVEITGIGWTSFEEGSRVTAAGRAVRKTSYYQVRSFVAEGKGRPARLALRLVGSRLAMSETVSGRSVHRNLERCR